MKKEKVQNRLSHVLLEIADDLRRIGMMDEEAHRKIALRHLGGEAAVMGDPVSGEEIH